MNWIDRDKESIWHPFTQLVNGFDHIMIEKAEGLYLYTPEGRKIMDAISSWWVNLHGHSHPKIAEAVFQQASKLEHVIFAGFTHEPAIILAEKLLSILPENQSKIFYSDNGSTANEVALKMAFQFWYNKGEKSRTKVIAFEGAYHGDTFGAMSVGDRGPFSAPFSPFLFDVEFLPTPTQENEAELIIQFEQLIKDKEVAAFIFEPLVLGSAGMKMYAPELLDKLLQLAKENEVICIADEVFTGFGRTGKNFASDYLTTQPDIFCLSKGLTGGTMALGVTSCTARIMEAYKSTDIMKTFFHGHSFTANPIACAASIASFDLLMKEETQMQIRNISDWQKAFQERINNHPKVLNSRVMGTIFALELKTDEDTSYVNEVRHQLYPFFLERDILLRPLGNVIYILPPYIIKKEEIERIYQAVEEMLIQLNIGRH
ncbi:adenosylmethionine--8-amino-7-oxononanoate transaminase [Marivirga sp. S37H4]|uniref:Adenosylmethionine-8-amino-7-oxononanoate aminotransferase n=1 Tax=Marivirga aurantiaca TaxID=2802615 RepID=A0A934X0A9_9BACT|nr:adenosylmethionine--8-amino-7-oxononanoate transaminase [Marivirga aurantiaca]MBK6266026.1 adenosylmethionine--8-amino-7-oxononanoate transaminase [Marivirga aurantiaca]